MTVIKYFQQVNRLRYKTKGFSNRKRLASWTDLCSQVPIHVETFEGEKLCFEQGLTGKSHFDHGFTRGMACVLSFLGKACIHFPFIFNLFHSCCDLHEVREV